MNPPWCCSSYMSLHFGVSLDIFISTGLLEQTKSNSIKIKYTVDSDLTFFFFYFWPLDLIEKNRPWVKYSTGWDLFFIYISLSVFDKTCDSERNVLLLYFYGFPCEVALKKIFKTESKRSAPLKQQGKWKCSYFKTFFFSLPPFSVFFSPFLSQSMKDK